MTGTELIATGENENVQIDFSINLGLGRFD
jgi:hypothetical protein